MKTLAIITARGGSRRIPRKNIKEFCGKPILAYTIEAALKSEAFTTVMVSTDDDEIAQIAISLGAEVPFRRSADAANDYASTDQVIAEVLRTYENRGEHYDRFACLYPTAPFLTPERLKEAMDLLASHESVMPVVAYSYPPQRSVVIRDGLLVRRFPEYLNSRSQDLERFYHDCGQFYCCRTDAFFRGETTDVDDLVPVILDEREVQDIDTPEDWEIAEEKYIRLHPDSEKRNHE